MRSLVLSPPAIAAGGYRPARHVLDRVAILNNSGHTPGSRSHLISLLADYWRDNGIEVIELSGTARFVEADLLFLHLSRPVIPEAYRRFAAQYPVAFNAQACDIRKHLYADGQLEAGARYKGAVIARPAGGQPVQAAAPASGAGFLRSLLRRSAIPAQDAAPANDNYRIYPSLGDVPAEKFNPGHIVQKFLPEEAQGRYLLRQYYFLGDRHFLSLQTSGASIIRSAAPMSLEEWAPPADLLSLRRQLNLDYGRIDFVQQDGRPFVINVSRSPALPVSRDPGHVPAAYQRLAAALAETLADTYSTMEMAVF